MDKLKALALSLKRGAESTANLSSLDEQYERAENLSNSRVAKQDSYGQVSPLAAIADVLNNASGRRDMRSVEPQRAAARQGIADNANALPLYQAGVNVDKAVQDQANFESTAKAKTKAAQGLVNAKQAAVTAKNAREDSQRNLISKVDPSGTERTVRFDKKGNAYTDEGLITDFDKWTNPAKKTEAVTRGGYGGKTYDKKSNEHWDSIMAVDNVNALLTKVTPDQAELMNSPMQRAKMAAIERFSPTEFTALVESSFSGYDEATQKMLIALNATSAEERHRMFGSALTETEYKSTQSFLAATVGRGLPWMMNALEQNKKKNVDSLLTIDGNYGDTKYQKMLRDRGVIAEGYKPTSFQLGEQPEVGSGLAPPPADAMYPDDPDKQARYEAFKASRGQ